MKKLVFTAIAVIAFSGVSMAETTEVKSKSSVVMEQLEDPSCYDNAIATYEYVIEHYNGGEDDVFLLDFLFSQCR